MRGKFWVNGFGNYFVWFCNIFLFSEFQFDFYLSLYVYVKRSEGRGRVRIIIYIIIIVIIVLVFLWKYLSYIFLLNLFMKKHCLSKIKN